MPRSIWPRDLERQFDQPQPRDDTVLRGLLRRFLREADEGREPTETAVIVEGIVDGRIRDDERPAMRPDDLALMSVDHIGNPVGDVPAREREFFSQRRRGDGDPLETGALKKLMIGGDDDLARPFMGGSSDAGETNFTITLDTQWHGAPPFG